MVVSRWYRGSARAGPGLRVNVSTHSTDDTRAIVVRCIETLLIRDGHQVVDAPVTFPPGCARLLELCRRRPLRSRHPRARPFKGWKQCGGEHRIMDASLPARHAAAA